MPDDFASRLQEALRARIEEMTLAEAIPAIEAVAVDADDRLWVIRTPLPPTADREPGTLAQPPFLGRIPESDANADCGVF